MTPVILKFSRRIIFISDLKSLELFLAAEWDHNMINSITLFFLTIQKYPGMLAFRGKQNG